ncbi:hypothetical protein BJ878DRAFT_429379 [Calycina marina]|uniref:Uncharacterized protein n=1 Tax=Calycina marina TaxID=1763456 RepID=A0A9P7YXC2_9HELO|nr:hypothetical protein BJ878DRAFT_429379 [Calycina marina]
MVRPHASKSDKLPKEFRIVESRLAIAATILVIGLVFTLLAVLFQGRPSYNHDHIRLRDDETCGSSPAEALRASCIFEPILIGWVPWRCQNAALASEFLERKNWTFSKTKNSTGHLSKEEFMAGEWSTLYTTYEFYVLHCTYAWRKVREAAKLGKALDEYLADAHQVNHCEMVMLRRMALETFDVEVYSKSVNCPRALGGNSGRFGWYRVLGGKKIYRQP